MTVDVFLQGETERGQDNLEVLDVEVKEEEESRL